jgi:glucosamine-6-phosphate deaminase
MLVRVVICGSPASLGSYAAAEIAARLSQALSGQERARLLLSTGESQFETLRSLVRCSVDWWRVDAFHLDEYVGLPLEHPASFRRYLRDRVAEVVPVSMHYVDPSSPADMQALTDLVATAPMDASLVGIGENGHLAFNDPPADFEVRRPYLEVLLAETCREQQVREGWFSHINEVPQRAITMSISTILLSRTIISAVPHAAKAPIIRRLLTSSTVSPDLPASVLSRHPEVTIVLDRASSQLLPQDIWAQCIVL